ncbi:MAG: SDR family oxidoreductase [Firmicutes bacterium]|nr:SDR family oxidoreductase [Bacillota bacterium]
MMKNKVAVITGGERGIGKAIAEAFKAQGAKVCVIDIAPNDYFVGDVGGKATLENFADKVIKEHGKVDYLINNAPPANKGLSDCSYEDFESAMRVGVTAPFYLAKLFDKHFAKGAVIINISSTRANMSQPNTESYTAAKGGISALTHALASTFSGRVRVNTISPGWIGTTDTIYTGADATQHPVGRVGKPEDIAEMVMFLCSDKAGFITGQDIAIDGGMTKQMIYHGDHGWMLEEKE